MNYHPGIFMHQTRVPTLQKLAIRNLHTFIPKIKMIKSSPNSKIKMKGTELSSSINCNSNKQSDRRLQSSSSIPSLTSGSENKTNLVKEIPRKPKRIIYEAMTEEDIQAVLSKLTLDSSKPMEERCSKTDLRSKPTTLQTPTSLMSPTTLPIPTSLMSPVAGLPPLATCGNGKSECKKSGIFSAFPCKRCHREFYCSEEHQLSNMERHKTECFTPSNLEVISQDEEYVNWYRYAAPHLYDVCLNFVLVWPSLTVQWLPTCTELENDETRFELLIGTLTNYGEMNHLLICGIDIPNENGPVIHDGEPGVGSFTRHRGSLHVMKRINHEGEIHRARYMPQSSNIIATKSPSSEVFIFDTSKFPEVPDSSVFQPTLRLKGHKKEGYSISWNPTVPGRILSGSNDNVVCLWDINTTPTIIEGKSYLNALTFLNHHTDVVEDVAWHMESSNVCASVGDDKRLVIWDIRAGTNKMAHCVENAHSAFINAVNFASFSEYALATGSSDKTVGLWDLRNIKNKLHSFESHKDEVMQVEWSPHTCTMLSSTGKDRHVCVWNIESISSSSPNPYSKVSDSMDEDDASEGPPELLFIHGGHILPVNDIAWNHHEIGMLASVSEDNILQIWKITPDILQPECSSEGDAEDMMIDSDDFEEI